MRGGFHDKCFVCGRKHEKGLKLKFELSNNIIFGTFKIPKDYQGYEDILHGGIVAAILDSSMVNLFHLRDGLELKTVKISIRYKKQIPTEKEFNVSAYSLKTIRHIKVAKAQIKIDNTVYAEAEGFFA